jgi:hypothetical protein
MSVGSPIPSESPARSEAGIGKPLLVVFLICLGFYIVWFAGVEWWRQRRGPWEITFGTDGGTNAVLEVRHPRLGIQDVQIRVAGAPLPQGFRPQTVSFDGPEAKSRVPFGEVRFLDTTFLPGTVTLEVLGHEIELLPRVLTVDKVEHVWRSGTRLELRARPR